MTVGLGTHRPSRRRAPYWWGIAVVSLGLGLAMGLWPSGNLARACSCLPPPPPTQALEQSTAVFDGTVTRIDAAGGGPAANLAVSFTVHTQWKGLPAGSAVVTTSAYSASCGYGFGLGLRYLVYATGPNDALSTSLCSRTRPYDAEEAAELGPPLPTEQPTASPGNTATATSSPPICTPPPCPCGRLVGECPDVRCEACTATPQPPAPEALFLPRAHRPASP